MDEQDPGGSYHRSPCNKCGVEGLVMFDRTAVERRPWRLVWECDVCGETSVKSIPRNLGPALCAMTDYAGGSRVSRREVREFASVDLEVFDELVQYEILSTA